MDYTNTPNLSTNYNLCLARASAAYMFTENRAALCLSSLQVTRHQQLVTAVSTTYQASHCATFWSQVTAVVVSGNTPRPPHPLFPFVYSHLAQVGRTLQILLLLWRKDIPVYRVKQLNNVYKEKARGKRGLLFTVTVALLVAVPCWLVATALYSAVSLTTHL